MATPETVPCKQMFSNGSEYEWFVETQCMKCKRLRNGLCRIYTACADAMYDPSRFPYDDLLDYKGGYGGKLCKRFTDEPVRRKKRVRPIEGQLKLEVFYMPEVRAIDANELLEKSRPRGISEEAWVESTWYKLIDEAPTIEPETTELHRVSSRPKSEQFVCITCGEFCYYPHCKRGIQYKFCPNCGRKVTAYA